MFMPLTIYTARRTSRLPVIYVFGKKDLDIEHAVSSLVGILDSESRTILLKSDVIYSHRMSDLTTSLQSALTSRGASVSYTPLPSKTLPASSSSKSISAPSTSKKGMQTDDNESSRPYSTIIYIGGETLALSNLLMTNSQSQVLSYDPTSRSAKVESSRTNRMLMRRYAVLQKARDADVIGILVGTLGVGMYTSIPSHPSLKLSNVQKTHTISCSIVPPPHKTPPHPPLHTPQKKLYNNRREAQPSETRKLSRN